jgi:hypothetical protein
MVLLTPARYGRHDLDPGRIISHAVRVAPCYSESDADGTARSSAGVGTCERLAGVAADESSRGNQNVLKHGLYTRVAIEERRQLEALMRQSRRLAEEIE